MPDHLERRDQPAWRVAAGIEAVVGGHLDLTPSNALGNRRRPNWPTGKSPDVPSAQGDRQRVRIRAVTFAKRRPKRTNPDVFLGYFISWLWRFCARNLKRYLSRKQDNRVPSTSRKLQRGSLRPA